MGIFKNTFLKEKIVNNPGDTTISRFKHAYIHCRDNSGFLKKFIIDITEPIDPYIFTGTYVYVSDTGHHNWYRHDYRDFNDGISVGLDYSKCYKMIATNISYLYLNGVKCIMDIDTSFLIRINNNKDINIINRLNKIERIKANKW